MGKARNKENEPDEKEPGLFSRGLSKVIPGKGKKKDEGRSPSISEPWDAKSDRDVMLISPEQRARALNGIAEKVQSLVSDPEFHQAGMDVEALVSRLVEKHRALVSEVTHIKSNNEQREQDQKARMRELIQEIGQKNRLCREQNEEIQKMHTNLSGLESRHQWEYRRLKEENETLIFNYERAISASETKHAEEKGELSKNHNLEMAEMKRNIQMMQKDAEEREKEHLTKWLQRKKIHEMEQAELKKRFEDLITGLKEDQNTRLMELKDLSMAREAELMRTHMLQQTRLQEVIQSNNKAIIAREKFTAISDGEIKMKYSAVVRDVDALARIEWTSNTSPWTNKMQREISDKPKRLRKQILQDDIWSILIERIFCSPFRIFGQEGEESEAKWNKVFGQGARKDNEYYTWPEPYLDTERWRYETLRQCEEALKIETSEVDPRTRWRRSFQLSLKVVNEKLIEVLAMVTAVDERMTRDIGELSEKAARMWVTFGTQRCRLLVVTQGLKATEVKKAGPGSHDKSVELLTQPELRRIGDADGQHLDLEQTVHGCEGHATKILFSG